MTDEPESPKRVDWGGSYPFAAGEATELMQLRSKRNEDSAAALEAILPEPACDDHSIRAILVRSILSQRKPCGGLIEAVRLSMPDEHDDSMASIVLTHSELVALMVEYEIPYFVEKARGPCSTCRFSWHGAARGWSSPCSTCAGHAHNLYVPIDGSDG